MKRALDSIFDNIRFPQNANTSKKLLPSGLPMKRKVDAKRPDFCTEAFVAQPSAVLYQVYLGHLQNPLLNKRMSGSHSKSLVMTSFSVGWSRVSGLETSAFMEVWPLAFWIWERGIPRRQKLGILCGIACNLTMGMVRLQARTHARVPGAGVASMAAGPTRHSSWQG